MSRTGSVAVPAVPGQGVVSCGEGRGKRGERREERGDIRGGRGDKAHELDVDEGQMVSRTGSLEQVQVQKPRP